MSRNDFIAGYMAGINMHVAESYLYDPSDYFRSYADDDLFDVEVCGDCFIGVSKEDVYRALGRAYDDYEEYAVREFCRYPDGTTSIELVDISDGTSGCRSLIDSLGSGRRTSRKAKTRRTSSFADDMDYVSEIPYNQCVICTFGPDEYGRGGWCYDIYLKSGDWISSNIVEFPTEDAAIDDAMDRLDRTGFENVSRGVVVASRKNAANYAGLRHEIEKLFEELYGTWGCEDIFKTRDWLIEYVEGIVLDVAHELYNNGYK